MSWEDLKKEIENDIQNHPILIYMKGEKEMPMCGFSATVVGIFKELGVPFETRNTLKDLDNYRQALKSITDWHTIPQVFIGGEFIGGCDITLELHQQGELQKMVEAALPK
ncbi:MAG: Grx4 family monothiol glutaredoxin [Planctomycetota bacterium]|nr:MAG: Grx4 family monothiol glutaredoxin [Planctomycetota bacterium]